jgi:uncharacterized membrane protein YfcA
VFGPRIAVTVVAIPIFAANTLLLTQGFRKRALLRGLGPIIVASIVGTAIGTLLLAMLDQKVFALLISAMVVVFLVGGDRLLGDDPTALRARIVGPLVCFVGGLLQGTTSIASPLVGSYFHAQRLAPADFVFVLAAIFQLNSIVQLIGYSAQGLYSPDVLALGLAAVVPTLVALALGVYLRGRLDVVWFRRFIVVLVILSVVNLLWRTFVA